jgi:hypothetical protein
LLYFGFLVFNLNRDEGLSIVFVRFRAPFSKDSV